MESTIDYRKRIVPLRGAKNFRDLGGYRTGDGRMIRWRLLFRSGHLAGLTRKDRKKIEELEIDAIIDFRSDEERKKRPNRVSTHIAARLVELPMLDAANSVIMQEINERLKNNRFDDFDAEELMKITNRQLALDFADEFRAFLTALIESRGRPVLWHCSGGKDRTGFASAIVLKLLGVDYDTIEADYMLSNVYADSRRGQRTALRLFRGQTAVNALSALFEVRASWLAAAFEAIDDKWGGFDTYRKEALLVTDEEVEAIKDRYLQE